MDMTPAQVDLHIDELVLDGLDGLNSSYVGLVVQRELARLLSERGVPPSWQQDGESAAYLDGGTLTVSSGLPANALGARMAQAIYTSFSGGQRQ